jgi:hypothetical protein
MAYNTPGGWAQARAYLEESMAILRECGDTDGLRFGQIHLAHTALAEARFDEARSLLTQSLAVCQRGGEKRLVVECLHGLAEVAEATGNLERAARLFGAAQALQDAIGFAFWREYESHIAALRQHLGETTFAAAWESGHAMSWQQAADYALQDLASS